MILQIVATMFPLGGGGPDLSSESVHDEVVTCDIVREKGLGAGESDTTENRFYTLNKESAMQACPSLECFIKGFLNIF